MFLLSYRSNFYMPQGHPRFSMYKSGCSRAYQIKYAAKQSSWQFPPHSFLCKSHDQLTISHARNLEAHLRFPVAIPTSQASYCVWSFSPDLYSWRPLSASLTIHCDNWPSTQLLETYFYIKSYFRVSGFESPTFAHYLGSNRAEK